MVRLSLVRPISSQVADLAAFAAEQAAAAVYLTKAGGAAVKTHALSGELQLSSSGWGLLKVPNALVRGAFDALDELGAELPLRDGRLNAHVTVFRPEELEQIGGAKAVKEFGHHYHYTLGPIKEVVPAGWDEMSKCWFIEVESPELKALRKSYGLTGLLKDDKHPFHATIAVRRKGVLHANDKAKGEEKSGGSRDGRNAGVQLLAGDDRAVREPGAHSVPGLWRSGDHRVCKVAGELLGFLPGYGETAGGLLAGPEEKLARLLAGELSLVHEEGAGTQQEKQSAADARRGDADPGGVVGTDGTQLRYHNHPDREGWLVDRESVDDAFRVAEEDYALADSPRSHAVDHRLGQGDGNHTANSARSVEVNAGSRGVKPTDSTSISRRLKSAEKRGPEDEHCPHCDARLERDPYSGTCNSCGKDWPQKEASIEKVARLLDVGGVVRDHDELARETADRLMKAADGDDARLLYNTMLGYLRPLGGPEERLLDLVAGDRVEKVAGGLLGLAKTLVAPGAAAPAAKAEGIFGLLGARRQVPLVKDVAILPKGAPAPASVGAGRAVTTELGDVAQLHGKIVGGKGLPGGKGTDRALLGESANLMQRSRGVYVAPLPAKPPPLDFPYMAVRRQMPGELTPGGIVRRHESVHSMIDAGAKDPSLRASMPWLWRQAARLNSNPHGTFLKDLGRLADETAAHWSMHRRAPLRGMAEVAKFWMSPSRLSAYSKTLHTPAGVMAYRLPSTVAATVPVSGAAATAAANGPPPWFRRAVGASPTTETPK